MIDFLDLGVAALLGVALFFFLRHLVAQMRQDRIFMEERMMKVVEGYNEAMRDFREALSELTIWLKSKNGR